MNIGKVKLKGAVLVASGTFGYGSELKDLLDYNKLGGIITKTVTLEPREGNPLPRVAECASGLLNTIGLQNIGIEKFITEKLPELKKLRVPVIVSVAGKSATDYVEVVSRLKRISWLSAIELNLSCPNLKKKIICQDEDLTREIVRKCVKLSSVPIIVKLSPQLSDIASVAANAMNAGANVISLVNTFPAMAIDIKTRKPKLSTITGGLSGPAIKPLALRALWEVYKETHAPIIGGGGILCWEDAIEFMLAGAGAICVGTATFINPSAAADISEGIENYLKVNKIRSIKEIVGQVRI